MELDISPAVLTTTRTPSPLSLNLVYAWLQSPDILLLLYHWVHLTDNMKAVIVESKGGPAMIVNDRPEPRLRSRGYLLVRTKVRRIRFYSRPSRPRGTSTLIVGFCAAAIYFSGM